MRQRICDCNARAEYGPYGLYRCAMHAVIAALSLLSCQTEFERRPSRIDRQRVLSIRSEPAEARPGESVEVSVLVASPEGTVLNPLPAWAFCLKRPPAAAYNVVADECLEPTASWIQPAGAGTTATVTLPAAGCQLFGSEPMAAASGALPIRALDPDETGGYYQPIRASIGDATLGFGSLRIACALFQAPADVAREYRTRYVANRNPELEALERRTAEALTPGSRIPLTARFGRASRETYVVYAPERRALDLRTERLQVSWYATGGVLESDSASYPSELEASNVLTAPDVAGTVHLWAVLRDERGGQSFRSLDLEIR
jgi:hypothetical protein